MRSREKEISKSILSLLQNVSGKKLVICGALHASLKSTEKVSEGIIKESFSQGIQKYYSERKKTIYSFMIDAYKIHMKYIYNSKNFLVKKKIDINDVPNAECSFKYQIAKNNEENIAFADFSKYRTSTEKTYQFADYFSENVVEPYSTRNLYFEDVYIGYNGYILLPEVNEGEL